MCYPISVRNRKSKQPCAQASVLYDLVLNSHTDGRWGGKHWGIEIKDRPRECFLPWKPCPFSLEIYCRVGGAGQLGSCILIVVRVWLHLDVLLLLWVHWRKGVWRWEWPEDWRLWFSEGVCQDLIGEIIAAFLPVCWCCEWCCYETVAYLLWVISNINTSVLLFSLVSMFILINTLMLSINFQPDVWPSGPVIADIWLEVDFKTARITSLHLVDTQAPSEVSCHSWRGCRIAASTVNITVSI